MRDDDDELPEAMFGGEWYRWECAQDGEVHESEIDERGQVVTCDFCGLKQRVQS